MRFPVIRFSPGSVFWGALFLSSWLVTFDRQSFAQSAVPLPSFGAEEHSFDAMTLGRPSTSESLAMRGFTLRQENDLQGAIDNFEAALRKGGLDREQEEPSSPPSSRLGCSRPSIGSKRHSTGMT
jgi:hypothetical protein